MSEDQTSLRGVASPEVLGPREQALIRFAEAYIAKEVARRLYIPSHGGEDVQRAYNEFEMAKMVIEGMVLAEINRIVLSPADSIRFAEALLNPGEPNENLRRALRDDDMGASDKLD